MGDTPSSSLTAPDLPATAPISADALRQAAIECGFSLVGFARPDPIDARVLDDWLAAGYAADMVWMWQRREERLDPKVVLENAQTVLALAVPYHRARDERSEIARYARGRDYHYTHRDRMKHMRRRILALAPGAQTYACVDTGVAMEKIWAQRAGIGWVGKNSVLINRERGSWFTLSVMYVDRAVDKYDEPHADLCGDCTLCLTACPTEAFVAPKTVDARRCISYLTIENPNANVANVIRDSLREKMRGHIFGCDVCQEVCPFNRDASVYAESADPRQVSRPIGTMTPEQVAALSREEFAELAKGTAILRAGYDGIRRNAILSLATPARAKKSRELLLRLSEDASPVVADVARWALAKMNDAG